MSYTLDAPFYTQSHINRIASLTRTLNNSSPVLNNIKEQFVSLELQIANNKRLFQDLRYKIRKAKQNKDAAAAQHHETELLHVKSILRIVKNKRNRLYNEISGKTKPQQVQSARSRKNARLRKLFVDHQQYTPA